MLTAVGARVSLCVSLLATGVARVAGGGLLYHGVGLGVARGDDFDVNGLAGDVRLVDARQTCLMRLQSFCRGGLA